MRFINRIIVEPETILVTVYEKDETGNWFARKYTNLNDAVKLKKFQVEFLVADIYNG